jgi:hypothetical protein
MTSKQFNWYPILWQHITHGAVTQIPEKIDIACGISFDDLRKTMDDITFGCVEFDEFRIEPHQQYDYGSNDPRVEYHVEGFREETDAEFELRLKEITHRETANDEQDRLEFDRLKAKLGK